MTMETWVRDYVRVRYAEAISYKCPVDVTVDVYDMMQDVKWVPEDIATLDGAVNYLTGKIRAILFDTSRNVRELIVGVDRRPPPVKRMVAHATRYKNTDVYSAKAGPYLPRRGIDPIPRPWINFAGNYKLLQRELYPRLFNALMNIIPRPGQKLILHGFPGVSEYKTVPRQQAWTIDTNELGQQLQIHEWSADELPLTKQRERADPNLYNRIYLVEHVPKSAECPNGLIHKQEWREACNDIAEMDIAMFFYDHWYQGQNMMFHCNDGDVIPQGLMYAQERVTLNNVFRSNHYACLPYKRKSGNEVFAEGQAPRYEYIDFNKLYILVKDDAPMLAAGIQNHVATLVFLIIMSGCDFFQGFMKGIGAEKGIWPVFFKSAEQYRHLVQMSKGVLPDTRTPRAIVIDEQAFRLFICACYEEKYGKPTRKRVKRDDITMEDITAHVKAGAKGKDDEAYLPPGKNECRKWSRQVLWTLEYYKNGPLGAPPNPFDTWKGFPYYGYEMDATTGKPQIAVNVAAGQRPVDETFSQHFYSNHKPDLAHRATEQQKQNVISRFGGKRERE